MKSYKTFIELKEENKRKEKLQKLQRVLAVYIWIKCVECEDPQGGYF